MSSKQHARGLGPPADRLALYHVPCGTAHRDRHRQTLRHALRTPYTQVVRRRHIVHTNTSSWVMWHHRSVPPALSCPLRGTVRSASPPRHHSLLDMTARYGFFSARGWGLTPGAGAGGVAGS